MCTKPCLTTTLSSASKAGRPPYPRGQREEGSGNRGPLPHKAASVDRQSMSQLWGHPAGGQHPGKDFETGPGRPSRRRFFQDREGTRTWPAPPGASTPEGPCGAGLTLPAGSPREIIPAYSLEGSFPPTKWHFKEKWHLTHSV